MPYLSKNSKVPTEGKGAKLGPKMVSFINEYFIDFNAKQAVLRAGYKTKNPSLMAAKLLSHPLVQQEIEKRSEQRKEKAELKAEYLITKLIDIIDSDKEKTADQLRAIELAGKSIALWKERQELSGPDGQAIQMEQKTEQNVAEFKSKLDRLAKRNGTDGVTEFPKPSGD